MERERGKEKEKTIPCGHIRFWLYRATPFPCTAEPNPAKPPKYREQSYSSVHTVQNGGREKKGHGVTHKKEAHYRSVFTARKGEMRKEKKGVYGIFTF
jgi:hypothetical protein